MKKAFLPVFAITAKDAQTKRSELKGPVRLDHGLDAFVAHGNVLLVYMLIRQHLDDDALQWYRELNTDLNQGWIQPSPDT